MHPQARAPAPVRFKTNAKAQRRGAGQLTLFPNDMPPGYFGVAADAADRFKHLADDITEESAAADYEASSRTGRGLIFRSQERRDYALQLTGKASEAIAGPAQAYSEIEKLRSPAVVKGVLTLWNCANERGAFRFRGTRLSHIMRAGGYKPTSTGQYTQDQKREFTSTLYTLQNWRIYIDRDTKDTDDSGRLQDMIERRFFSLLEIERALYAKRRDGTPDESVIVRLTGELLPGLNAELKRGRPYPKALLGLDAGRDGQALLLGFKLSTRIDQLRQGNRPEPLTLTYELGELIRLAGRAKDYPHLIERQRRYKIRQALARDLKKLVAIGCIASFDPERLPLDELERVTIWAPTLSLPAPTPGPGPAPEPTPQDTEPAGPVLDKLADNRQPAQDAQADTAAGGPSSPEVTPAESAPGPSSSEVTAAETVPAASSSEVTSSRSEVTTSSPEVTPEEPSY